MSWAECIFQLFFSIQGPAFFILPNGFKNVGYLLGVIGALGITVFYAYMMHIYLWCESELRRKKHIPEETNLSIYSLNDLVFTGSSTMTRVSRYMNTYLKYEIILSWSLSLSFAELFICQNVRLILRYFGYSMTNRMILITMFPLTTLMSLVPDLKVMSCIAYLSTIVIIVIMFEILYFILIDPSPLGSIHMIGDLTQLSTFLATVFFTINCTPLIFPLKQEMKKPSQFGSIFGSFNSAMFILIVLNICFSLFGYIKYGDATDVDLIQNLPQNLTITISNCLLTVAITACGAISFFVIFETIWCDELVTLVNDSRYLKLYEYMARISTNLLITVMAIVIPTLEIFINLISCFSYPYDTIFLPALLQCMIVWNNGKRDLHFAFIMIKNFALCLIGVAFSVTSFLTCLSEISSYYNFKV